MPILDNEVTRAFNDPQRSSLEGIIYSPDLKERPILSMIGDMNNLRVTNNFQFNASVDQDYADPAQPAITEDQSLTAPNPTTHTTAATPNVVQMFQKTVAVSDMRQANPGLVQPPSGGDSINPDAIDYQLAQAMVAMGRDIEFTALAGVYALAGNSAQANRSTGLINAVDPANVTDLQGAALDRAGFEGALETAWDNGAKFMNGVVITSLAGVRALAEIYGFAPASRTEGGVNLNTIYVPGVGAVALMPHRFMSAAGLNDQLLIADMSVVFAVGQDVPGKGNFYVEELAKTGAGTSYLITGFWGLAHGPGYAHALIDNVVFA